MCVVPSSAGTAPSITEDQLLPSYRSLQDALLLKDFGCLCMYSNSSSTVNCAFKYNSRSYAGDYVDTGAETRVTMKRPCMKPCESELFTPPSSFTSMSTNS